MKLLKTLTIICVFMTMFHGTAYGQQYEFYSCTDIIEYLSCGKWNIVMPVKTRLTKKSVVRCSTNFTVKEIGGARRLHECPPCKDGKQLGLLLDKYIPKAQSSTTTGIKSSIYDIAEPDFQLFSSNSDDTPWKFSYLLIDVHHFEDNAWSDFGLPTVDLDTMDHSIRNIMLPENGYQLGSHKLLYHKSNTTADSIRWYLNDLVRQVDENQNNMVMLYLSSHGTKTTQNKFCLIAEDSEEDFRGLLNNVIKGSEINNCVRQLVEKRAIVLVFVDACYAGTLYSEIENNDDIKSGSVAYFLSTEGDLVAHQDSTGSLFAKALTKALSGDEPLFFKDNNNIVSPSMLERYIYDVIAAKHKDQNPRSERGAGIAGNYKLWTAQPRTTTNTFNDLLLAADKGNTDAMVSLGDLYYKGDEKQGIVQDYGKAFSYYKEAFAKGNKKASPKYGICFFYGHGVAHNYNNAFMSFYRGYEVGDDLSKYYLGVCYAKGLGTKKSKKESKKVIGKIKKWNDHDVLLAMRKEGVPIPGVYFVNDSNKFEAHDVGHDMGDIVANRIVNITSSGWSPEDERWITRVRAGNGNVKYQAHLGAMCLYGWFGEKINYEEAVKWLSEAAKADNASALCNLGYCYEYGKGVSKDHKKAMELINRSADKGYSPAFVLLGNLFFYGTDDIKSDYWEAANNWLKAANKGNRLGMYKLGMVYRDGWGVGKDEKKAFELISKSAKKKYPAAQFELGRQFFEQGEYNEAFKWLIKASKQGYIKARTMIKNYYYPDGKLKPLKE